MRLFSALPVAAFGAVLFAVVASANAQEDMPRLEDFSIFPTQITGQTCVESADKNTKCATLTSDQAGTFVDVATLAIQTHGSRDVMVQFCAKVEDEEFQELECQAVVDSSAEPAPPGAVKPTENPNDQIYVFCMSWFGETLGAGRGVTTVDIQCSRKKNEASADVNINDYVLSVFSK